MKAILPLPYHRLIFIGALIGAFASLSLSKFTLSVFIITISVNWLLDGQWNEKFQRFRKNRAGIAFLLIYLSLFIGLAYTSNFESGIKELSLKITLFIIPLVFLTSSPLKRNEKRLIIHFFTIAVLASTFISTYLFFSNYSFGSVNIRNISPFISHIRLALMVNIAIACIIWLFDNGGYITPKSKILTILCITWLVFFLLILQSLTGFVILLFIIVFFSFKYLLRTRGVFRTLYLIVLGFLLLAPAIYITIEANRYFKRESIEKSNLPEITINGNPYKHHINYPQYENGNLVWILYCEDELKNEWNKRSTIAFDSIDRMGQPIYSTITRYLASMGIPRDSVGVWSIDSIDVELIESGVTSVVFRNHRFGIYPRLYQLFWELDQYFTFDKVSGSSLVQRYVFLKAALELIKDNFWFGVGTGDLVQSFNDYYLENVPNLKQDNWYISHNQFLTQFVQLGIWGFLIFLLGWFYPIYYYRENINWLGILFFIIITLSMLNEDTLQTHIGISLASLFYSLLIFNSNDQISDEE
jgi:O-antigen ligase